MKEVNQNSFKRQVETLKRGLRETDLTNQPRGSAKPRNEISRFELLDDSSSSYEFNPESADYAKKHTKNLISSQTLVEGIMTTNPIPPNVEGKFHIDAHLRGLLMEQGNRLPLNQDKISFEPVAENILYLRFPSKIWTV